MIYDKRDVQMVANVINNLGPKNDYYRARMVIDAMVKAGIGLSIIASALDDETSAELRRMTDA